MDTADATKMIQIMSSADGGCSYCARALYDDALKTWPKVDWAAVLAEIRRKEKGCPWQGTSTGLERAIKGEPRD